MLGATIKKQDKAAKWLIWIFSIVIFIAITFLGRVELKTDLGFDKHLFAKANAIINTIVSLLLVAALVSVKQRNYLLHKRLMYTAMVLSVIFLLSYVAHHLFTGETRYGDLNLDGVVDAEEKIAAGGLRMVYFILLATHIVLAALILPFVLFTAYRGLTGEWEKHKKLAKYTWPLWFYVAITGPIIYLMISPYYAK